MRMISPAAEILRKHRPVNDCIINKHNEEMSEWKTRSIKETTKERRICMPKTRIWLSLTTRSKIRSLHRTTPPTIKKQTNSCPFSGKWPGIPYNRVMPGLLPFTLHSYRSFLQLCAGLQVPEEGYRCFAARHLLLRQELAVSQAHDF